MTSGAGPIQRIPAPITACANSGFSDRKPWPGDSPRERERYLRARWLFTLFYLGGLRISEVSGNTMGCFFCRRDADGHERWWLEVIGKGDKEGLLPAPAEMMVELGRYRRERGLSALPSRHEDTPLVLPLENR